MPYRRKSTPHERSGNPIWPSPVIPAGEPDAMEAMEARASVAPAASAGRPQNDERPRNAEPSDGRWWTRTTDLFLIREAL